MTSSSSTAPGPHSGLPAAPRTALITGASSGIGRALAQVAASEGFNVLALARREQRLTEICTDLTARFGIRAEPVVADLARPDTPTRVAAELTERGHVVDLLVNNASFLAQAISSTWRGMCIWSGFRWPSRRSWS